MLHDATNAHREDRMTATELRGSRWLYEEPTPAEVGEWFKTQPIHDGMSHDRYIGGVVLISATEKYWPVHKKADGEIENLERYRRVWTPYISVSTRVRYFRDYVRLLNYGQP